MSNSFIQNLSKDMIRRLNSVITKFSQTRNFIIYGTNETAINIYFVMKSYNIGIAYFIDDVVLSSEIDGVPVLNKYDLLVEELADKFFLSVKPEKDFSFDVAQFFLQIGLFYKRDFIDIANEERSSALDGFSIIDAFLISSRYDDLPGFKIFGDKDNKNAKVIVTLGGSTSDPHLGEFTSWPEYLYRKLSSGMAVVVYCGGMAGYASTQELIKFIRDVVPLSPHLVISYSGINDIFPEELSCYSNRYKRPFIGKRTEKFFKDLGENYFDQSLISFGLQNDKTIGQYWIDNMRMMHCISLEFDSSFLGIFQPVFCMSNTIHSVQVQEYADWYTSVYNKSTERIACVYNDIRQKINACPYIMDYSTIFEKQRDVFLDQYHVSEKANRIIADTIYTDIIKMRALGD
jgi:hypothetical protein